MVLFWLQGSKLFRYFLRFYAHCWFTEGILIKEPFHTKKDLSHTRTPFFQTQWKNILCFKCQMVKNIVPVKGLCIWEIHSRSPHHSGSEETSGRVTRCMPRDRWTRIKAVMWDISSRGCFSGGQVHFQKPQNV